MNTTITNVIENKQQGEAINIPTFMNKNITNDTTLSRDISRALQSKQIFMHNTDTKETEILYDVKYIESKNKFIIKGKCSFGESITITIKDDEYQYDTINNTILTYNPKRSSKWFKLIAKKPKLTLYNCNDNVNVESLFGKNANIPLKLKVVSKSYFAVPKFKEGNIIQYQNNFIIQDDTVTGNHISNILSITYLTSDVYVLYLIDSIGEVQYTRTILADREGLLVIGDEIGNYFLKIIPL